MVVCSNRNGTHYYLPRNVTIKVNPNSETQIRPNQTQPSIHPFLTHSHTPHTKVMAPSSTHSPLTMCPGLGSCVETRCPPTTDTAPRNHICRPTHINHNLLPKETVFFIRRELSIIHTVLLLGSPTLPLCRRVSVCLHRTRASAIPHSHT